MLTKRVGILRKRADLEFADFNQHWATGHAALVAQLPGVVEYVQNPVIKTWCGARPAEPVDGMIEVWFDGSTVVSADQHTSAEQRDDEARFLEAFTAFTVTNLDSYDAEAKVWVLLTSNDDADTVVAAIDPDALELAVLHTTSPEPGTRLMERPLLEREDAPPAAILIFGCDLDHADKVYDAVVAAASSPTVTGQARVLLTRSRRIR
jgi:uncharacterized protein (TIGR02118 family)